MDFFDYFLFFWFLHAFFGCKWHKIDDRIQYKSITIFSIEIKTKIPKFSIFDPKKSRFAQIQTRILTRPQLSSFFCELYTIKQLQSFNLSYCPTLVGYGGENYCEITKILRQNRKFFDQKNFFQKF